MNIPGPLNARVHASKKRVVPFQQEQAHFHDLMTKSQTVTCFLNMVTGPVLIWPQIFLKLLSHELSNSDHVWPQFSHLICSIRWTLTWSDIIDLVWCMQIWLKSVSIVFTCFLITLVLINYTLTLFKLKKLGGTASVICPRSTAVTLCQQFDNKKSDSNKKIVAFKNPKNMIFISGTVLNDWTIDICF